MLSKQFTAVVVVSVDVTSTIWYVYLFSRLRVVHTPHHEVTNTVPLHGNGTKPVLQVIPMPVMTFTTNEVKTAIHVHCMNT